MTSLYNDDAAVLGLEALAIVFAALLLLLLWSWRITRKPKNRRTGLPRPWRDPRDVLQIHRDILNQQRSRRVN